MLQRVAIVIASLMIAACVSTPVVDRAAVNSEVTPAQAVAEGGAIGATVNWGGRIVATTNSEDHTEIEVLALPLDSRGRPLAAGDARGRFIARAPGFLEPTTYRSGALVTTVGTIEGLYRGRIGEADYTYPVLRIDQIRLVDERGRGVMPYFSIGVGIEL